MQSTWNQQVLKWQGNNVKSYQNYNGNQKWQNNLDYKLCHLAQHIKRMVDEHQMHTLGRRGALTKMDVTR